MADGNSGSSGGAPKPKTRNPVERALVWGLIGILLLLLANEGWSRMGYSRATSALSKKMKLVDENPDAPPLTAADVRDAMGGKQPSRKVDLTGKMVSNGAGSFEEYEWFTIHPTNKLKLFVYYGHKGAKDKADPDVITFSSEEEPIIEYKPPTEEELAAEAKRRAENPQAQMGGPMVGPRGMMGGPPGRGGPPGGPGGGRPAHNAERPNGDDSQPAKGDDKPADDKPADEKPAGEKADEAKPGSDQN